MAISITWVGEGKYATNLILVAADIELIPYDKKYTYDWNFKNGTTCGISEYSKGLKNFKNIKKTLSFSVRKKNSYFGWGNIDLINEPIKLANDFDFCLPNVGRLLILPFLRCVLKFFMVYFFKL